MRKKLKKQNGETLIESLVSVLISVMAMGILASSLMASARINYQNKIADEKFAEDLKYAEGYLTDAEHMYQDNVNCTITFEGSSTINKAVTLYGGEDGKFAAYKEVVNP